MSTSSRDLDKHIFDKTDETTMSTTTATETLSLENTGVFTNPKHDLWVAETGPSLEEVKSGADLKEGEVYIGVKSTGICGSDCHFVSLLSRILV